MEEHHFIETHFSAFPFLKLYAWFHKINILLSKCTSFDGAHWNSINSTQMLRGKETSFKIHT
jgi:hypothetical protein